MTVEKITPKEDKTVTYKNYLVARKDPAAKSAQFLNTQRGWSTDIQSATPFSTALEATYAANISKADHVLEVTSVVTSLAIVLPPEYADGESLGITNLSEYLYGKKEEPVLEAKDPA